MARLDLVIADSNSEYCDFVFRYLKGHYYDLFRVDCYTDNVLFNDYLCSEQNPADILLINSEFFLEEITEEVHNKTKVIVELVDNTDTSKSKYRTLDKYISMDEMAKALLQIYKEEYCHVAGAAQSASMRKQALVIPVLSPEGGSGKTVIATTMSALYGSMGKKAFYLNLEKYYSPSKIFAPTSIRGISDILFHIRNQEPNIGQRISSYKITDADYGVDYLSSASTPIDMEEMNLQEVLRLIDEIKTLGIYDAIIIDTDSSINFMKDEMIKICTKIIIPYTYSSFGQNKMQVYIRYLEKTMQDRIELLKSLLILTANKTTGAPPKDTYKEYCKAPVPFPYIPEVVDNVQHILKHKAAMELYNVLNMNAQLSS